MSATNVWAQMNYVPPRGQCNFRASMLSSRCPCLRFMLHPLKSASSFECDGCNHHASFHSMENKTEDEIRKRWEVEAKDKQALEGDTGRPRKRLRELEYGAEISNARLLDNGLLTPVFDDNDAANNVGLSKSSSAGPTKTKPKKAPARRGAAKKATGRVTEILDEEDDEFIELD